MLNAKGHTPTGKVRPSVMAFSRQGMPNLPGTSKEGCLKGGYIVHGGDAKPDVILLATGAWQAQFPRGCPPCCQPLAACAVCRATLSGTLIWAPPGASQPPTAVTTTARRAFFLHAAGCGLSGWCAMRLVLRHAQCISAKVRSKVGSFCLTLLPAACAQARS